MGNGTETDDPFDLNRFVQAQEATYPRALAEIKQGAKQTHWMWFIFPQLEGLGSSSTARFYAIKTQDEARAYLNHPILGNRLLECCQALLQNQDKSASDIFGYPDDLKLRSCMTLFAAVSQPGSVFSRVLQQYFQDQPDQRTLALLNQSSV